jgi:orotate phosphoribosyltransferase-like protein
MTFNAYIQNIYAKTGKSPEDFRRLAQKKGYVVGDTIRSGVKAGEIVEWLKAEFDLGRGHAMAIYMLLKGQKSVDEVPSKKNK